MASGFWLLAFSFGLWLLPFGFSFELWLLALAFGFGLWFWLLALGWLLLLAFGRLPWIFLGLSLALLGRSWGPTACLRLKSIQKQLPNWAPNCSKFIPGWLQNPPQNGSKMCLGTLLEPSWRPLGYGSIFRSLIFASSWPLGALLEASGPKKVIGNGSWTARGHRGDRFQLAWGPKTLPKRAQEGPKTRSESGPSLKWRNH